MARLEVPLEVLGQRARPTTLAAERAPLSAADHLFVAQDRITLNADAKVRFLEAAEQALHFGQGELHLFASSSDVARRGSAGQGGAA